MLAVVQPYCASPDVAHRPRSTLASTPSVPSSRSATSNLASSHPPSLQRHQTAPAVPSSSTAQSTSTATPPAKPPPSAPVPPPSASPPPHSADSAPFDIHSYPPTELLKLLALILTHIATTNDHIAPSSSSAPPPDPVDAPPIWHSLTTASRGAVSTPAATLTFHARNIPTISLEAYLLRILKYCPTSNHVFLSLLVYFDRMSKLSQEAVGRPFVIDSYNIHRLVIAGVTVASKFFSDVFYTNSRYAKVGGLPLPELNQLELQFLLLNDFRLVVSSADMQDYAEQLILFSKSSTASALPLTNGHTQLHTHQRPPVVNGHHTHPHHHNPHHPTQPASVPVSTSSSTLNSNGSSSSSGSSARTVTHAHPNPSKTPVVSSSTPSLTAAASPPSSSSSSSLASSSSFTSSASSAHSILHPTQAQGHVSFAQAPVLPGHMHRSGTGSGASAGAGGVYAYSQPHAHVQYPSSSISAFSQPPPHPQALPHPHSASAFQHPHTHPHTQHPPPHPHPHSHLAQTQHHPLHHPQGLFIPSDPDTSASEDDEGEGENDFDADASTDAGTDAGTETDTSTEDEPTVRGPPTVVGGGGGGAGGSIWGDGPDQRMGSP